jgi:hypothetical protein
MTDVMIQGVIMNNVNRKKYPAVGLTFSLGGLLSLPTSSIKDFSFAFPAPGYPAFFFRAFRYFTGTKSIVMQPILAISYTSPGKDCPDFITVFQDEFTDSAVVYL